MDRAVKRVVVLGGGSAGFMAALALKVRAPSLSVTVIRSKEIGIIGVGEGSTVALTLFLHDYLKVSLKKFHELARPTWKLGLRFIWGPRPYFNYSFGAEQMHHRPAELVKPLGYYCEDDVEHVEPIGAMMAHDRVFEAGPGGVPKFHKSVAYHFENERYVAFLESYASAVGVSIVEDTVADVRRDELGGVEALVLASGRAESADLFIDGSGFASLLLGKTLGEPFVPYASSLFCNRAVVGGWARRADDEVVKPYTTCETMDAGWCWQIEHEDRVNRGYVYASAFISDEEAEREFRAANPKVGPTRVVRFTSGRYARAWVHNVVAIGNASGFVEPLEATALGVIGTQSRLLAEALIDADLHARDTHAAEYNDHHARCWEGIRSFIAVHYKFNTRRDTPFWQACRADTDLAGAARPVAFFRENGPSGYWAPTMFDPFDAFGAAGYATLLVGMRVPYNGRYEPSEAERKSIAARRQRNREAAQRAMGVRDALNVIRSPRWRWVGS